MASASDDILRTLFDERVYHWQRVDPGWPGHNAYVALRVGELHIGDRYREENYECAFACQLQEFLDGCFHESLRAVFGEAVLAEIVDAVKAEVGPVSPTVSQPVKEPVEAREEARQPAPVPEKPPAPARAAKAPEQPAATPASEGRVALAIVSCPRVDLTLATALRAVTRKPMSELLSGLRQLPYVVARDLSVSDALAVEQRLAGLGATFALQ